MKKILIVAKETFFRQIKSWGFIFMVLGPFIIVGINIIIGLATAKSAHQKNCLLYTSDAADDAPRV